jgi:hypothetical protein
MSDLLRGVAFALFLITSAIWIGILTGVGLLGLASETTSALWLPLMMFAGILILIGNRQNLGRLPTGVWIVAAFAGFLLILTNVPEFESLVASVDPYGRYGIWLLAQIGAALLAFMGR